MNIISLKFGKLFRRIIDKFFPINESEIVYTRSFMDLSGIDKSTRSQEAINETLIKGVKILDELDVPYGIGRGTILGIHRDKKYLPGDIDVDIDVFDDKLVYQIIRKMPFDLVLLNSSGGRYMQIAFIDRDTDVLFDIWFYHEKAGVFFNRNYYGFFYLPTDQVKNLSELEIGNGKFPALEPEWFCKYWYGKDWKTPIAYDTHWTNAYQRDCAGFKYLGTENNIYVD